MAKKGTKEKSNISEIEIEIINKNLKKIIDSAKTIDHQFDDISYEDIISFSGESQNIISNINSFALLNNNKYCLILFFNDIEELKKRNEYIITFLKYIELNFDYIFDIKYINEKGKKYIKIIFS